MPESQTNPSSAAGVVDIAPRVEPSNVPELTPEERTQAAYRALAKDGRVDQAMRLRRRAAEAQEELAFLALGPETVTVAGRDLVVAPLALGHLQAVVARVMEFYRVVARVDPKVLVDMVGGDGGTEKVVERLAEAFGSALDEVLAVTEAVLFPEAVRQANGRPTKELDWLRWNLTAQGFVRVADAFVARNDLRFVLGKVQAMRGTVPV